MTLTKRKRANWSKWRPQLIKPEYLTLAKLRQMGNTKLLVTGHTLAALAKKETDQTKKEALTKLAAYAVQLLEERQNDTTDGSNERA